MRAALGEPCCSAASNGLAQDRAARLDERARQDREIVYFLQPPETHAFDLYHDLTESREGVDKYLNVVRAGSTVTNPRAVVLDTGETLPVETLKGEAITKAAIDIGEPVRPESEVVVIRFPKLAAGQTLRLRISETYTDRAGIDWRATSSSSTGPSGGRATRWCCRRATTSPTPRSRRTVSETDDGRIRLDFENPRPDEIAVLITARKRRAK